MPIKILGAFRGVLGFYDIKTQGMETIRCRPKGKGEGF